MKIVFLTALIAAVACSSLTKDTDNQQWPWQVGKLYRYDVKSYNLARLQEGASSGNAFKATFIVRVKAPGRLEAKLENPLHAKVHQELPEERKLPSDLQYQPVKDLDRPFEVNLKGGRVLSLSAPSSLSLPHENLLKGLISTLQVDLSTHRNSHSPRNTYDKETQQGQFKKMETDVTGDCETLYTVSPMASEWRRELPNFSLKEDPIEISKSKNYDHCHHRVAYHFGVPQGAEWTGTAEHHKEEQFISRATNSRMLVGKQGPIYKAETTSTVHVHPHVYGKQKAEVLSYVKLSLKTYEDDKEPEWQKPEELREIKSLLYAMTTKQIATPEDFSSSSESKESKERVNIDIQTEDSKNRVRRSPKAKIVSINKIILNKRNERSSSSWEDTSDSRSSDMNDKMPLINEPAYASLFMDPQPVTDNKETPANVQKLVQEIAQQLQNPNNMPKADFLSKFNILVRLISSMSYEQLTQTSRSFEVTKSSTNNAKADMWMIYRDAVTQSGNLPAFKQIVSWIENKKIEGEEAAEVVATLVHTLRYPTKEVMTSFFKLAMSPEVKQQKYLNTTAVIAAARFINKGQVNNDTAHYYYPTHMYGRLANKHDNFVQEQILPSLKSELEKAIQKKDNAHAQVYIKAIGNLGHRSILNVFAPYLEGKIPVSTYLRTLMVENLQILANQKDNYARNVLYSILRNTAEPYEVRLAAIMNIFAAQPTSAMMQAMAQMTHDDPSIRVRAALKITIEAAAKLEHPRFLDLARKAQVAQPMLTSEDFGGLNLGQKFNDFYDNQLRLGVMNVPSSIGSEDSLFPKHLRFAVRDKTSGWNAVSTSFSSVQRFMDFIQKAITDSMWENQPEKSEPNHKYSASKISEMLKIMRNPQEPLQADLRINLMKQERYFTFTEEDLKKLPSIMKELVEDLQNGVEKHYTKILNQAQVSVMFPVATGMPFIYRYKEPTVIHIQGKAKGNVDLKPSKPREFSANVEKEIQFTFARNLDGSVGFYDTLSNQHASAGVVNKVQINIPVKINVNVKEGEVKIHLEPLRPEQDTTIVHFSVWPYTANQKKDTLVPISLDTNTKIISRMNKVNSMDFRFGQSTGTQFQLQGNSYSTDYASIASMLGFKSPNMISNIIKIFHQKDIALTHYNLKYLGKSSQNKGVTVTAVYDTYYNQKQSSQNPFGVSKVQDTTPNSAGRREELLKRVSSGINTAKVQIVDLSATFEGPQKSEFVLTAAIAQSPVDNKIQYVLHASKNSAKGENDQVNGVFTVLKPDVSSLNLLESLKKDLKMNFNAQIKCGDDESDLQIQGYTERTKKYVEDLQKLPWAKKAIEEIGMNNYYQESSHKMLVMAHAPDSMKATITYKNVSPALKYMIFRLFRIVEGFNFWNTDVNPLKTLPEGKIELEVRASYLEDYLNLVLKSRYGEVQMKNAHIPKVTANAVSTYYPFDIIERVGNFYTRHQYQPYCTVDDNKIRTFSERTYDYTLTPSWHVIVQDAPRPDDVKMVDQLVVLARKPSQNQQEIYISYQSETGSDLEIEIKPAPQGSKKPIVNVKTNCKKVSGGDLTMYWDDLDVVPFLQYYMQPDGVFMLRIRGDRLRIMYDGQRLVVLNKERRNNTRGICGYMSGEPRDDYMTPHGLVDKPEHYGASYALNDESDAKTQQLQSEAKNLAYQREYKYTNILRSDKEWQRAMESSSSEEDWGSENVYRSRGYSKVRGACELTQQVQYYENHGEICITTAPLPACQSHCSGEGYSVTSVQVVCRPKLDQVFQSYRNQIRKGENPTVQGVPQEAMYRVPASCKA